MWFAACALGNAACSSFTRTPQHVALIVRSHRSPSRRWMAAALSWARYSFQRGHRARLIGCDRSGPSRVSQRVPRARAPRAQSLIRSCGFCPARRGSPTSMCKNLGTPTLKLVRALARLGFATLRVDRAGVGDSEPLCTETDLGAELGWWRAAHSAIAGEPRID